MILERIIINGIDKICDVIETKTIVGIELSYSIPSIQLPINQNIPNDVSNIPNPVDLLFLGTNVATADFKIDSCAPIPIPQSATPKIINATEWYKKINSAKNADNKLDKINTLIPNLSYITPNISAAIASINIAPEYIRGKKEEGIMDNLAICIVMIGKSINPNANKLIAAMYIMKCTFVALFCSLFIFTSKFSGLGNFFLALKRKYNVKKAGINKTAKHILYVNSISFEFCLNRDIINKNNGPQKAPI